MMTDDNAIAIVGIGCRAPGADNAEEFWDILRRGECKVGDVPSSRWNSAAYLDPDSGAFGKAYVQKGAFMKDIHGFDHGLFDIKEFEAIQMDPQQRLLLECTFMALQDAGITRKQMWGTNTGVFIGSMNDDHGSMYVGCTSKTSSVTATGSATSILAGRLSYVFNLLGPCMVIDTACSSSLVALHQACLSLRAGDCDIAICGGVSCMTLPDIYVQLCKAGMLSPKGLPQAFSKDADGYTRGEGCGVIVLTRLKNALQGGANVLAVVAGTGTNQDGRTAMTDDGRTAPISAPSSSQQRKLLQMVYRGYSINVSKVDYIETHGTGTPTGDPVEVNALGDFFTAEGEPRDRYIGSLKTNIGHTESAAGVLGVIKVVLMMKHNMIVPSLHCNVVNPKIDLEAFKFLIPKKAVPWYNTEKLAGCSGFGVGGSNSHVILASYNSRKETVIKVPNSTFSVICFSAKSEKSLKESLQDFLDNEEARKLNILDLSYTSTVRRDHYGWRTAFVVDGMDDLVNKISDRLQQRTAPFPKTDPDIAFVFCGMGTAWFGMCKELMAENKVFGEKMAEVDTHLRAFVKWSLRDRLQKEESFGDPVFAPIAIFACQVSLAAVWETLGIRPKCVLGQSVGEVAATYVAGCLSLADAVKVIYHRSKALATVTGGGMVLVRSAEVHAVRQVLTEMKQAAVISQEYSPTACAVSARLEDIAVLKAQLEGNLKTDFPSVHMQELDVSVAYHSHYVNPCAESLAKSLKDISASPPRIPLISTVTGSALLKAPDAEYWVDNIKEPVLFRQAVQATVQIPDSKTNTSASRRLIFLEVGPTPVLKAHLSDLFPGESCTAIPSMSKRGESKCFLQAAASLYENGADILWSQMSFVGAKVTAFPRYMFDRKHLRETSEMQAVASLGGDFGRKAHLFVLPLRDGPSSFGIIISPLTIRSIYDHVIGGRVIVPGALYAETAFAVAMYKNLKQPLAISAEFEHAAAITKNEVLMLSLHLETFCETDEQYRHCFTVEHDGRHLADITIFEAVPCCPKTVNLESIWSRCSKTVGKTEIYALLQELGFAYGPSFSLLEKASTNAFECMAQLKINNFVLDEKAGTTIHPSILDGMLQSCILLLSEVSDLVANVLPKSFGRLTVFRQLESSTEVYTCRRDISTPNIFVFDLKLLTEHGELIAELNEFVVQSLAPDGTPPLSEMLTLKWRKVPPDWIEEKRADLEQKTIFITDIGLDQATNKLACLYDRQKEEGETIASFIENNKDASAVVFVFSGTIDDDMTDENIQSCVLNVCCNIQNVLKMLSAQSVPPVFCLCTFNAWEALGGAKNVVQVNPIATALWGLLRTFVVENPPLQAVSLELHTVGTPETVGVQIVSSIQYVLLEKFQEVLVNEDGVFVNQVLNVSGSIHPPAKRMGMHKKMRDLPDQSVILSEDPEKIKNAFSVQCTTQKRTDGSNQQMRKIKAHAFAQAQWGLLRQDVTAESVIQDRQFFKKTFVIMALETVGTDFLNSQEKTCRNSMCCKFSTLFQRSAVSDVNSYKTDVAVCFPTAVSNEIFVPESTVVPTSLIPDYKVGDLSRLILLRSLFKKLPEGSVTILASAGTRALAEVIKLMCEDKPSSWPSVNIVCLETVGDETCVSEIVLALVQLDESFIVLLGEKWLTPCCLVTLHCLVCSELMTFLSHFKPQTQISLVDTRSIFHPNVLKREVPEVTQWILRHKKEMPTVVKALHFHSQEGHSDIRQLMLFKSFALDAIIVRAEQTKLFQKDGSYIVVGGLTGLGWLCVEYLAHKGAGFVAIFNRRSASPEQLKKIQALCFNYNCQIQSYQVDVTSMTSLEKAWQALMSDTPHFSLRGVFFGAAVTKDKVFSELDRSSFDTVLSPKVKGSWNLHRITQHLPLDYFVMHSSVASFLGNRGQANYSAGNAFMDGLAFYRRQQDMEAQTINWGPLDTGLLENKEEVKQKLKRSGFEMASEEDIKNSLESLLHHNWTQSVPVKLDIEIFAQRMMMGGLHRMQNRFPVQTLRTKTTSRNAELQGIWQMESEKRLHTLVYYVRELASGLVGVDASQVSEDTKLFDLGLDSVTGMELISWIQRDTSLRLQPVDVVTMDATVSSVAETLSMLAEAELAKRGYYEG